MLRERSPSHLSCVTGDDAGGEYGRINGRHWLATIRRRRASTSSGDEQTAYDQVDVTWRYLLVSEADIEMARGSWAALKALGDT